MIQHRDSQGRIINEGDRVAYNLSGDVVPGVVVDTSNVGHIKVRRSPSSRPHGHAGGHISRVKNPRSILVLAGVSVEAKNGSTWWLHG